MKTLTESKKYELIKISNIVDYIQNVCADYFKFIITHSQICWTETTNKTTHYLLAKIASVRRSLSNSIYKYKQTTSTIPFDHVKLDNKAIAQIVNAF